MALDADLTEIPEVGALFMYRGRRYLLTSYLCERERPTFDPSSLVDQVLLELEEEEDRAIGAGNRRIKLRYCLPREAMFVTGSGVGGCIAPLREIEVVGMVDWDEELLSQRRASVLKDGQEGHYCTTIVRR